MAKGTTKINPYRCLVSIALSKVLHIRMYFFSVLISFESIKACNSIGFPCLKWHRMFVIAPSGTGLFAKHEGDMNEHTPYNTRQCPITVTFSDVTPILIAVDCLHCSNVTPSQVSESTVARGSWVRDLPAAVLCH